MNNFGLGLVLSFTDNASSGMNNAARTFQNLSATADQVSASIDSAAINMYAVAQSMIQVGDTMTSVGSSILGVFTTLGEKVIDTGMTMQGFRMTLSALYGEDAAESKIKEIKDYAATSVFEIEGLMRTVTMMKAVGIEAMDDVTTSSGQTTQKLMDYASDLAAMMPQMKNMYGTGVEAAMGAFKEYIAEGNTVSLKRGASLDILQILGEDKGATIEERTQQVADLIEKLGIAGYTAQLYGTPMQQISNISDVFFNIMSEIADSGVFDSFCSLLSKASGFLMSLTENEERFNAVTSILGDTLTTLMAPLHSVLDFVIANADAFLNWAQANPALTKTILLVVAAIGSLLVAGGTLLKMSGSILMLVLAFGSLDKIGPSLTVIGAGFKAIAASILPLIAMAGLLYLAYRENLFGIRDLVNGTIGQIVQTISLVFDSLADNTLSYENYNLAEQLGLLPFLETLMDIKYRFGFFVQGVKDGVKSIIGFLNGLWAGFSNTDSWLYDLLNTVGEFFKGLMGPTDEAEEKWYQMGELVAKVASIILGLVVAFKAFGVVVSVVTKVVGVIKTIISIGSKVLAVFKAIGGAISVIAAALNLPVIAVVGIIAGIVALVALIVKYRDQIWSFLQQASTWIYNNVIRPIVNYFINVINFLVGLVYSFVDMAKAVIQPIVSWFSTNVIEPIKAFFSSAVAWIQSNVIQPIVGFFNGLWTSITNIVSNIVLGIQNIFSPIAAWIDTNVIQPIVSFFTGLITSIGDIMDQIKTKICDAFSAAADFVKGIWEGVSDFFGGLWDKVTGWAGDIAQRGSEVTGLNPIPAAAKGVDNFVGGLIQVNESGGELIELPSGSTVIPHDQSVTDALRKGIEIGAESMAMYSNPVTPVQYYPTGQQSSENNEYHITFAAGSVIVKCSGTSDAELEKVAEKLLKIIKRKLELKKMAQRNTGKQTAVFA